MSQPVKPLVPITQHFLAALERPSNWTAIRFKRHKSWIGLSWLEYYQRAEAVACGLDALGVKPGDRIALVCSTRWEWRHWTLGS